MIYYIKSYCGKYGPNETLTREAEVTFRSGPLFNSAGFRCQLMCNEEESNSNPEIIPGAPNNGITEPPKMPVPKSNCCKMKSF